MNNVLYRAIVSFVSDNIIGILIVVGIVAGMTIWVVARWTGRVDASMKENSILSEKIEKLSKTVNQMHRVLVNHFGGGLPVEISSSPITLSDYGKEISNNIDAGSLASRPMPAMKA